MKNGKKMYDLADSIEVLASVLKSNFHNKSNEELKNQLKWILDDCYKLNRFLEEVEE